MNQPKLPALSVLCVLLVTSSGRPAPAQPAATASDRLARFAGDWEVAVYPQPFGFLVQDEVLHLRVGGVGGDGPAAPLLEVAPGRFVLAPDHPNAFVFTRTDQDVTLTFYSGTTPFEAVRVGEPPAEPEGAPEAAASPAPPSSPPPRDERTRSQLTEQIEALAARSAKRPQDAQLALAHAHALYEAGEFEPASGRVAPLVGAAHPPADALALAAELAYLAGEYAEAERLFTALIGAREGDATGQVMAKVGLLFTYYQTNRFADAANLEFPDGVVLPTADLMAAFDQPPYEVEWLGEEPVSVVPFALTDPLPVLTIEVEGVPIHVLFDTGADTLILDTEIATALGVDQVSRAMGTFGGGRQQEIGFGQVERVRLGQVALHRVPIAILPTKRFSEAFDNGRYPIGGIIGTAFLRQFLGTLDYRQGRLVLRQRTADSATALRQEIADRLAAEVPFVLSATHLMMARGSLNGTGGLTFFVDSGLAGEAAFSAPIQTLEHVGIPVPELAPPSGVGGGGGGWESGSFPIAGLALGDLEQTDLTGEYGARPPASYWTHGFIEDGLISHRFFRRYSSWTIDFDSMTFLFER